MPSNTVDMDGVAKAFVDFLEDGQYIGPKVRKIFRFFKNPLS